MKHTLLLIALLCAALGAAVAAAEPRLIVVISLDQFPYEYIARFQPYFGRDGFRYLLTHGASFVNATYKHAATMTGPGHAALMSGSYGDQNGIIANSWYSRETRRDVYCVEDGAVALVGSSAEGASPALLAGSTFGDELRLATNFRSRVVAVSNKDRAAILMGGKLASGAFWMSDSMFITSTYYMDRLPDWVKSFNSRGIINSYVGAVWTKILPASAYAAMDTDDALYEAAPAGIGRSFPHRITGGDRSHITPEYYTALLTSPFGSRVLEAFAEAAVLGEGLGSRGVPDLLCVRFSWTDYVGHAFGPESQEALDMVVQMDRILADFSRFLDKRIGLRHCLIALSSDHGVAPIPEYVRSRIPHADAGRVRTQDIENFCTAALTQSHGAPKGGRTWIDRVIAGNIYLNLETLRDLRLPPEAIAQELAAGLPGLHGVAAAYSRGQVLQMSPVTPIEIRVRHSYNIERSGDVVVVLKPLYIQDGGAAGTSHGQPYEYDAHVPLILSGDGILPATFATDASPADLAPTLSALCGVEFPSSREGRVLAEALKKP